MTGFADDQLEARLAAAFHRGGLPGASLSLESALERVPDVPAPERDRPARARSVWTVLGLAAVVGVVGLLALTGGGRRPSLPAPSDRPSIVAATRLTWAIQWTAEVPASQSALTSLIAAVQKRVDASASAGTQALADGTDRVVLEVPAGIDLGPVRRLIGQRGVVAFVPLGSEPLEIGARVEPGRFPPLFDGTAVTNASITTDSGGQPALHLTLRGDATRLFADYTAAHINEYFAITVDGTAISVPAIQSAIPGGNVELSVGAPGTIQPLRDLATFIGSGPLPVALVEVGSGPVVSAAPSASAAIVIPSGVASSTRPNSPSPTSTPFTSLAVECEPPLDVEGLQMTCGRAVSAAVALLPDGLGTLGRITFHHACVDVSGHGAQLDCAVQAFGLVSIELGNGKTFVVQTNLGELQPRVVAPFPTPPTAIPLAVADAADACRADAQGIATIRIDPAASVPVWAERSSGVRLAVRIRGAVTAEAEPFPMILDDRRHLIAHDGTEVGFGDLSIVGTPVCLSAEDGAVLILGDPRV